MNEDRPRLLIEWIKAKLKSWERVKLVVGKLLREKIRFILIIVVLVSLFTGLAIAEVFINLHALEESRIHEYRNLTQRIGQMATNFVLRKQYNNLLDLMQLQTQTSAIPFMAFYVGGEVVLQSGNENQRETRLPTMMLLPGKAKQRMLRTPDHIYFDILLSEESVAPPERGMLRIAYSLHEFKYRKSIILGAISLIALLISALLVLYYLLSQTQARLRQEEATKTNMIKAIAHDALHYVTVIKMILDNQLNGFSKGKGLINIQTHLQEILESNDSLTKLLEDLKYNEYLRKGLIINRPEKIDWLDFLTINLASMQGLFNKKEVRGELISSGEPVYVCTDRELSKRVIMNLLHNAFKFTRPGSRIKIWYRREGQWLFTYIRDHGAGIPRHQWEDIFKPSVRLDDNTYVRAEDKRGTGLGLSNARQFVRLYGGELGVHESQLGVGTSFYFTLPVASMNNSAGQSEVAA